MANALRLARYRIEHGEDFRLKQHDPADTGGLNLGKKEAKEALAVAAARIGELQQKLYAERKSSLLVIFQAMDAAGKDSAIQRVFADVHPQGCAVHGFKAPSEEELDHDFLWRVGPRLPRRGHIGVFSRSYYEEVLVVRVHPDLLAKQRLPSPPTERIWRERFEDIVAFERHLTRNGTTVLKFFLHISREEQRTQLLERLDDPSKHWKFNLGDLEERKLWPRYMAAYEDAIRHTGTKAAPWFVVPADRRWFARLVVAQAVIEALERIDPKFPTVSGGTRRAYEDARKRLAGEK